MEHARRLAAFCAEVGAPLEVSVDAGVRDAAEAKGALALARGGGAGAAVRLRVASGAETASLERGPTLVIRTPAAVPAWPLVVGIAVALLAACLLVALG